MMREEDYAPPSLLRASEPGWVRVGKYCPSDRRAFWVRRRESDGALETCAGREGDDAYAVVTPDTAIYHVLCYALWAAEGAK